MDNEGSCVWGKKINQQNMDRYTKLMDGATYSIRNFRSHLLMHVPNEEDNPGTLIAQGADNGKSSQLWKIKITGDGYYFLFPHHGQNNLVMEVKDGATGNRNNLIINRLSGADKQKFFIYYNKDGSFRIITKVSNLESGVDVSDAAVYEGASVVQYTYIARLSQFWRFEKIDTIPVDTTPIDSFDFVGVRTADLAKINIYPNPSSNGKVTIDITSLYGKNDIYISVFDLRGIMVFNKELLKSDIDKHVLELPIGIYIIRISSGMDQYLKKIIIQ